MLKHLPVAASLIFVSLCSTGFSNAEPLTPHAFSFIHQLNAGIAPAPVSHVQEDVGPPLFASDDDATRSSGETSGTSRGLLKFMPFGRNSGTLYGLSETSSTSVTRSAGGTSYWGLGLEQPVRPGMTLNFELSHPKTRLRNSSKVLESAKAAFKLRFRF